MKRHLSALAVLFYILTVPTAQANPIANFHPMMFYEQECINSGCKLDKGSGQWQSEEPPEGWTISDARQASEDCEKICGKYKPGCIGSGGGVMDLVNELISGEKKESGCRISANKEPLAKEAMYEPYLEIIATTKDYSSGDLPRGCEALSPGACQDNRLCYLRNDELGQSLVGGKVFLHPICETLIDYGVEVEDEFVVPLPYPPYITQGGKPLEPYLDTQRHCERVYITQGGRPLPSLDLPACELESRYCFWDETSSTCNGKKNLPHFTWRTDYLSTWIRLEGSAAAKVKEPGGYIEWISVGPGGCFFDPETPHWTGRVQPTRNAPIYACLNFDQRQCEAAKAICGWDERGCNYNGPDQIPTRLCGDSVTQQTCEYSGNDALNYCKWDDDAASYGFTEERLDLCRVDSDGDDECGNAELEDLVFRSDAGDDREASFTGVVGLKNTNNLDYLKLGVEGIGYAGSKQDFPEYEPSWMKIKVGGALVTRVVVKVKDAQFKIMCPTGDGWFWPDTWESCRSYHSGLGLPQVPAIHALLLTDDDWKSFISHMPSYYADIRKARPSGPCTSSTVHVGKLPGYPVRYSSGIDDLNPDRSSWYANAPIDPASLLLCGSKPDGCDPIELDFRKVAVKVNQTGDRPGCDEGNYLFVDRANTDLKEAKYLYLWFPHGYLHLWSVDIYHYPKHYDIPYEFDYMEDAVRVVERVRRFSEGIK